MKTSLPPILATAFLAALLPSQVMASITLNATDDNYVYTDSSGTNYNSESEQMLIKNATSSDRIGYVKFDLSAVIGSFDSSQDAVLQMTFKNMSGADSGNADETFTFAALENTGGSLANYDWAEETVTYSSRPRGNFTDLGTDYIWSYNDTNVTHSITFSDIANYIQADNTITFQVFGPQLKDTGNNPYWHTSEASNAAYRPSLTLVPEPATASILMGLSTLALVSLRRRHK